LPGESSRVPIWAGATQAVWSLWIIAFVALSVSIVLSSFERWDPAFNSEIPRSATSADVVLQLRIAAGLSAIGGLLAVSCLVLSLCCIVNRRPRALKAAVVCGVLAAALPILVQVVLPWEDPYTGQGSPLATLIGLVILSVFAALSAIPGLIVTACGIRSAKRAAVTTAKLQRLDRVE